MIPSIPLLGSKIDMVHPFPDFNSCMTMTNNLNYCSSLFK